MNIAFLASGGGGTLRFIHEYCRIEGKFDIVSVLCDRACGATKFAELQDIPCQVIQYSREDPTILRFAMQELPADTIFITNIHKIIDDRTVSEFAGRLINLHYSLLPSFGGFIGMKSIEAARSAGVGFVGSTCHYVDHNLDGGPIIAQSASPVDWDNHTTEEIYDVVFRSACLTLLNSLVSLLGHKKEKNTPYLGQSMFSPPLSIPLDFANDEFWEKVRGDY